MDGTLDSGGRNLVPIDIPGRVGDRKKKQYPIVLPRHNKSINLDLFAPHHARKTGMDFIFNALGKQEAFFALKGSEPSV